MEENKSFQRVENKEQDIIFSKSIKAGKRIYYLDVKRNRKNDMFIAITESKKIVSGFDENAQVSFEKHKIFLYKEDFEKFIDGLKEVINFIRADQNNGFDKDSNISSNFENIETKNSFVIDDLED